MMRGPLPGEPSPEPNFVTKALDRIGAKTRALATSGSAFFSLMVISLAPVFTNDPTLAK